MADTAARTDRSRPLLVLGLTLGGVAVTALGALAVGVVAGARLIVTPARRRSDDVRVLSVAADGAAVTLSSDADTRLPGRYSFWFDRGRGHARLGEVLRDDGRRVERVVERVTAGDLRTARSGRLGGWWWLDPGDAGLPFDEVTVPTPHGGAPAWVVPARESDADSGDLQGGRWMIAVHGRGVTRAETLRTVPPFRDAGWSSLVVSYRNDGEAPRSPDGRYALGDEEWEDVEAALRWVADRGATDVVLVGWSMGGATVLQAATRASGRELVTGIVLESPVVDWRTTLRAQGDAMHLPRPVQEVVLRVLASPLLSRVSGRRAPIDLDRLDLVAHADRLSVPVLLLHSDDDGFVPSTASHALAAARPDLVQLEVFTVARHTKLWNLDPERFDRAISGWLARLAPSSARRGPSRRP
ncbi:alpha/beta hydrolase family protein [Frigoribacterium salinisoli]